MRLQSILVSALAFILLTGCVEQRQVTITPNPADANVAVDGESVGAGPQTVNLTFWGMMESHHSHVISASHPGCHDKSIVLERGDGVTSVPLDLPPMTKTITFTVEFGPAIVSVDGVPSTATPVDHGSIDLPFTIGSDNHWTHHVLTATRPGYAATSQTVNWDDVDSVYDLALKPLSKTVTIRTTPASATIMIDDAVIGRSPVTTSQPLIFALNPNTQTYATHTIVIQKAGYDPIQQTISWDNGQTDYQIVIPPRHKHVRITTNPPGVAILLGNTPLAADPDGVLGTDLTFTPTDDQGNLPTFDATVMGSTDWQPATLSVGWDGGQTAYSIALVQIKSHDQPALGVDFQTDADGAWQVQPKLAPVASVREIHEPAGHGDPALIYRAPQGQTIGSIALSPAGDKLLFTLLSGSTRDDFRSKIVQVSADGTGGLEEITDGKALDLYPAYTPDGSHVVFASNRAGRRLNIWRKSLTQDSGIEQLTSAPEQDLWPQMDASPHPRLFYQAFSDGQPDAQLYCVPADGGPRLDLATLSTQEPRLSPLNDAVLFTTINSRTGNREIYRMPVKGGMAVNLTNDPDSDDYDPAWSRDGSKIAFASTRGVDSNGRHNPDIWIVDVNHPDHPTQLTANASVDDCPVFDATGENVYFRSNRGGEWQIWKIAAK